MGAVGIARVLRGDVATSITNIDTGGGSVDLAQTQAGGFNEAYALIGVAVLLYIAIRFRAKLFKSERVRGLGDKLVRFTIGKGTT
jgi:hypothetical protein